jgi:CheY-like chemotaxis protein
MTSRQQAPILVIEDDASNVALVSAVLQQLGYEVTAAGSAEEAWDLLATLRPALVLADVRLPGQDGLAFTRQLKSDPATASVPVVALTAHARPEDRTAALQAGCAEWMTKPLDTRLLGRVLVRVLASR